LDVVVVVDTVGAVVVGDAVVEVVEVTDTLVVDVDGADVVVEGGSVVGVGGGAHGAAVGGAGGSFGIVTFGAHPKL
jgi:hypothetical protein